MKVEKDSMVSAYMLDHLYFISLFHGYEGRMSLKKQPNKSKKQVVNHQSSIQKREQMLLMQKVMLEEIDAFNCL